MLFPSLTMFKGVFLCAHYSSQFALSCYECFLLLRLHVSLLILLKFGDANSCKFYHNYRVGARGGAKNVFDFTLEDVSIRKDLLMVDLQALDEILQPCLSFILFIYLFFET